MCVLRNRCNVNYRASTCCGKFKKTTVVGYWTSIFLLVYRLMKYFHCYRRDIRVYKVARVKQLVRLMRIAGLVIQNVASNGGISMPGNRGRSSNIYCNSGSGDFHYTQLCLSMVLSFCIPSPSITQIGCVYNWYFMSNSQNQPLWMPNFRICTHIAHEHMGTKTHVIKRIHPVLIIFKYNFVIFKYIW